MCLAIPGKVEEILTEGDLRIGRVNFGGIVKRVCLDYVPEVQVGDSPIVHVGFALSKIDEDMALINHQRGLAGIRIFETSAKTGAGIEEWLAYLAEARAGTLSLWFPSPWEAKTGESTGEAAIYSG
jgi:hydrogenase expression/formation protein HypC